MTNQHDNPIYYAHSPLGMRPSDIEYGPMRYVRETDYHVAQRKIAELEAKHRARMGLAWDEIQLRDKKIAELKNEIQLLKKNNKFMGLPSTLKNIKALKGVGNE